MRMLILCMCLAWATPGFSWGFYAHRKINYYSVFLLPPEMLVLYKPNIGYLAEHAVDPDKRRYALAEEGPRHYIDIDHFGRYPYANLPRNWKDAVNLYSEDTLARYGIVPWWLQVMLNRLTEAFREKNQTGILRYSAEIGHYMADAHVPLHACSNHNGQFSGQRGIHGFWESRIPELLADTEWDFFIGKAQYIRNPSAFIWERVLESAAASDSVLRIEKDLSRQFPPDRKYSFETRNGVITRQYSSAFCRAYDRNLRGMIERRMRMSVFAVASFWFTAWVNAGQPDLSQLTKQSLTGEELLEFEKLNKAWRTAIPLGREHQDLP